MAGVKVFFYACGKRRSDPEAILRMLSGKPVDEFEAVVKAIGGRITLLDIGDSGTVDHTPFVKIGVEFPEWGTLQRNFINGLLAELLNSALSEETDLAFQFNPLRDEDLDGA